MKTRKRWLAAAIGTLTMTAGIALAVIMHRSSSVVFEEEYHNAFGMEPPDDSHAHSLAAIQAQEVSTDLEQMAAEKDAALKAYEALQIDREENNSISPTNFTHRQFQLKKLREQYQASQEEFDTACSTARYYKIPATFPPSC